MQAAFIVFDLDGTLIDGYEAIGEALAYAMERFGKPALSPEAVRAMVGHGIEKLLEGAVGPERAPEGVRLFRERYPHVAVEKTRLMPGVLEVLAGLATRGPDGGGLQQAREIFADDPRCQRSIRVFPGDRRAG